MHVVDQIRLALVTLMTPVRTSVYEGEVHPVTPDTMPGLCVWVGNEVSDGGTLKATQRELTVCIDGYAYGYFPDAELSAILLDVDTVLFADKGNDGRFFGGLVTSLAYVGATRECPTAPFAHGIIKIRYNAQYQTEDGYGETAE